MLMDRESADEFLFYYKAEWLFLMMVLSRLMLNYMPH
jgi:hypothetical protein